MLDQAGNRALHRIIENGRWQIAAFAMGGERSQQCLRPVHRQPGQTMIERHQMAGIAVHHLPGKGGEQRLVQRGAVDAARNRIGIEGDVAGRQTVPAFGGGPIERPGRLVGRMPGRDIGMHLTVDHGQLAVNGSRVGQVVQGTNAVAEHHVGQQLAIHPHAWRAHRMGGLQALDIAADDAGEAAHVIALHRVVTVQARRVRGLGKRAELVQDHAAIDAFAQGVDAGKIATQWAAGVDDGGGQSLVGTFGGRNQDGQGVAGQNQRTGGNGVLHGVQIVR